jgi:hypothetical protein
LALQLMAGDETGYFDLEDPATSSAMANPMSALAPLSGLVVVACGDDRMARGGMDGGDQAHVLEPGSDPVGAGGDVFFPGGVGGNAGEAEEGEEGFDGGGVRNGEGHGLQSQGSRE